MPIDPWMAALASFGGGMAAAGGPSRMPVGMGGAIGQGAMSGLAGYAQMREMQQAERSQQLENMQLMLSLKDRKREREKEEKQQAAIAEWSKNVDPQTALALQIDPAGTIKGWTEANKPLSKWQQAQHELNQKRFDLEVLKTQLGEQPSQLELDRLAAERRKIDIMQGNLDQRRAEFEKEGAGGFELGSGDKAQATEYLTEMQVRVENGYVPTPEDKFRIDGARSLLERETVVPTKEGGHYRSKNIAPFAADLLAHGRAAPAAAAAAPAQPALPGGSVSMVREGPPTSMEAMHTNSSRLIAEMADLLDQGGQEVAGPQGWSKDWTEPVKAAVGMEHDPTRGNLMTRHKLLKTLASNIMQKGAPSNQDTIDVNDALGNLPAFLSEPEKARDALSTVQRVLDTIAGKESGAPPAQHPRAPRQEQAPPPVPVGTVFEGYRFKGGDPNNEANWEPVR